MEETSPPVSPAVSPVAPPPKPYEAHCLWCMRGYIGTSAYRMIEAQYMDHEDDILYDDEFIHSACEYDRELATNNLWGCRAPGPTEPSVYEVEDGGLAFDRGDATVEDLEKYRCFTQTRLRGGDRVSWVPPQLVSAVIHLTPTASPRSINVALQTSTGCRAKRRIDWFDSTRGAKLHAKRNNSPS